MQPCAPVIPLPLCGCAGLFPTSTRAPANPAKDWFDSAECAAILAQRFEPETENPFANDCEPDPEIDA